MAALAKLDAPEPGGMTVLHVHQPARLQPDVAPTVLAAALPQTSSLLPLIAMLGLLALGGGFVLRIMQKRML